MRRLPLARRITALQVLGLDPRHVSALGQMVHTLISRPMSVRSGASPWTLPAQGFGKDPRP